MSSCIFTTTHYLSVTQGHRLKVMPGWGWSGGSYRELLNPVSVPAVDQ